MFHANHLPLCLVIPVRASSQRYKCLLTVFPTIRIYYNMGSSPNKGRVTVIYGLKILALPRLAKPGGSFLFEQNSVLYSFFQ